MLQQSIQIGDLVVTPPLALAPMSGVTDRAFRRVVRWASGASLGLSFTEFLSVEQLVRVRNQRTVMRMALDEGEHPVVVQIYGADPAQMAQAARMAEDAGADMVDINAGCPAPKVVRRGGGAALLKDLPALGRIIEATAGAVRVPVTVKIRSGWDASSIVAVEALRVAEQSGAAAISVHGRTREQLYRGVADWGVVREMVARASIPVLGSGDVTDPASATERLSSSGCAGLLVGRAAITNPWVFRQIHEALGGHRPYQPTWADRLELLRRYREGLDAIYHPKVAPGRLKMMVSRMLKGSAAAGEVRARCLRGRTADDVLRPLTAACERGDLVGG